jgi:hypothetical protein
LAYAEPDPPPEVALELPPEPLPVEPPAEPPIDVEPVLPPARPRARWWLIALMGVLGLTVGAGGYFLFAYLFGPKQAPLVETMDACRKTVSAGPAPAVARTKADALAKDGKLLDCQFLLYKYAAEKGDRDAARVLGTFYDPDTWSREKSPLPAPNPQEAARWHKQAAEAGDVESEYRYGMLLKLGRTDAADGPEQAQAWLRKAADAGHPLAKEALAK